ncbi:signal peptidase I [Paramicrobacterium chengjingii]|uniref:signal peptidase I n=1 Tax=Paramicrobacterium chengjingii TaxID=2769067 RepID=UPI0014207781|nr:signal peptidase I [Microbacterium chengjingii]
MTTSRRIQRWVRRALSFVIITGAAAAAIAGAVLPRLTGATGYAVTSGSMEQTLPIGSLVVVRPVAPRDITVGDIITYQLRSGEPEVATHRIISSGVGTDGDIRWRTQGDANSTADPIPVRAEQIKGVMWYVVPWLGYMSIFVGAEQKASLLLVVGVALLGYAAVVWSLAIRERRIAVRDTTILRGNTP